MQVVPATLDVPAGGASYLGLCRAPTTKQMRAAVAAAAALDSADGAAQHSTQVPHIQRTKPLSIARVYVMVITPHFAGVKAGASGRLPNGLPRCRPVAASSPDGQAAPSVLPKPLQLEASLVRSISAVGRDQWNACHDGSNPFVSYDFLEALEESGSVAVEEGWLPQHLIITATGDSTTDPAAATPGGGGSSVLAGDVLACVPLYLKSHSYGEYVFDSSWASAHDHNTPGARRYYPKLQSCVPFTPVTGPRLLVRPGSQAGQVMEAVARTLPNVCEELGVSGVHVTFSSEADGATLARHGFLRRSGIQYHWTNGSEEGGKYRTFDDFLAALQQKRRKSIRQERKKASVQI